MVRVLCQPALKVFHPENTVEKVARTTQCKDEQADADDPHQGLTAIVFHLLFTFKHYEKAGIVI